MFFSHHTGLYLKFRALVSLVVVWVISEVQSALVNLVLALLVISEVQSTGQPSVGPMGYI